MKYLDMPSLSRLTNMLTDCTLGDQMLNGRIEAYSCKKAGDDKKLSKALQEKFQKKRKRSRGDSVTILTTNAAAAAGGGGGGGGGVGVGAAGAPLTRNYPMGAASLAMGGERIPHSSSTGGASNQTTTKHATTVEEEQQEQQEETNQTNQTNQTNHLSKRPRSTSFLLRQQQMSRQSSNHSFEKDNTSHMVPELKTHASDLSMDGSDTLQLDASVNDQARKVIIDLISTLNAMHGSDYDFSESNPEQFVLHRSINDVLPIVNKNVAEVCSYCFRYY